MPITSVKIYPAIGIARLGNSPTEYFVGPERPGDTTAPSGGYRDAQCRIKRQAARFRLFGFDGNTLVQEITAADAQVSWTVHIANKKAAWERFASSGLRNASFPGPRTQLEIDPGPRTLTAPNQAAAFNTGSIAGLPVPLGEMRTEAGGQLLVLGGFGLSRSFNGSPLTTFANNDGWHDDVSDGPVTASVVLNGGGGTFQAAPAWVLCVPPKYAPAVYSVISLYDALFQSAVNQGLATAPVQPSFTRDIYPILQRAIDLHWVTAKFLGDSSPTSEVAHQVLKSVIPPPGQQSTRQAIFSALRNQGNPTQGGSMPRIWSDTNTEGEATLSAVQYGVMQKFAGNPGSDWNSDWPGGSGPPPPDPTITPDGLNRAALDACVGGALYPGIEASTLLRDVYPFSEPFRLNPAGRSPGDVTKQMALPWQADFLACYQYGNSAWWPAQRPDFVFPQGSTTSVDWIRDLVSSRDDMVQRWHQLGFILADGALFTETARVVVCKSCFIITDKSDFAKDEVDSALSMATPALFPSSFYVAVDGFSPSEIGITSANPSQAELDAIAPVITLSVDGGAVPGMTSRVRDVLLEDESLPSTLRQRFTFVYEVAFANNTAFSAELRQVSLLATIQGKSAPATLRLLQQPNPYLLDGATFWLSTDLRVFQIAQGDSRFGFTIGADGAAATSFIQQVLGSFNGAPAANHPFDTISEDPALSQLELSRSAGGKRVFNFAIARVRYRGLVQQATDVRAFFRMFNAGATGLEYDSSSTYARADNHGAAVPALGLQGGEIVTIPFFAEPRVDTITKSMADQTDPTNVKTLAATGGTESRSYFGCWLDFNQTDVRFPLHPASALGPFATADKSIQELIRGLHQCIVAELFFLPTPIAPGQTAASDDKLAQRNLVISESANPGSPASRTVLHTFEIKATEAVRLPVPLPPPDEGGEIPRVGFALASEVPLPEPPEPPPGGLQDELMIRWGNVPRATLATLYLPAYDANEVLALAGQTHAATRLTRVDDHTLRCLVGEVTFVPLPASRKTSAPALLSLELPAGVTHGQTFTVTVHQYAAATHALIGAFQFTIPVRPASTLLGPETRRLSVLRHIQLGIPADNRWKTAFDRYVDQIAERVRGFGGDPDIVPPSPDGNEPAVDARLRDLAVLGTEAVALGDRAALKLGSGFAALGAGGASGATLNTDTNTGDVLSVGPVVLRDRAHVHGRVKTGQTVQRFNQTIVDGGITEHAPVVLPNLMPFIATFPTTGGPSSDIQPGQTQTLSPGTYGSVSVKSTAKLKLTSGIYYIDFLDLEPQSELTLSESSGPVKIYVRSALILRGIEKTASGAAPTGFISYLGRSEIFVESSYVGTLAAPAGTLTLRSVASPHRGAFFARTVQLDAGATVQFVSYTG